MKKAGLTLTRDIKFLTTTSVTNFYVEVRNQFIVCLKTTAVRAKNNMIICFLLSKSSKQQTKNCFHLVDVQFKR